MVPIVSDLSGNGEPSGAGVGWLHYTASLVTSCLIGQGDKYSA